jgi:hypothetical protein
MASELKITVIMKDFESGTVFWRPWRVSWRKRTMFDPEGFTQFLKKIANKDICSTSRPTENSLERNVSSPTNRQFTVHLNMNWRDSSNARER